MVTKVRESIWTVATEQGWSKEPRAHTVSRGYEIDIFSKANLTIRICYNAAGAIRYTELCNDRGTRAEIKDGAAGIKALMKQV